MATIQDFQPLVGQTVRIKASPLARRGSRTSERIRVRGGSDGSFKVIGVTTAFRGVSPTLTGKPAVHFDSLDGKWSGWLPVEEIEIVA